MKMINYNRPFPANFNRFFDDHQTRARHAYRPAVNIMETDAAFELELLAPGRVRENFNIAFNDGVLEIVYTADAGTPDNEDIKVRRQEFKLTDFTRRFELDDTVINDEEINASYEDGILRLTLPKREEVLAKAPRQITVG